MAKYDPHEDLTTAPQEHEPTIAAIPVYWDPPICNPNPAGPIKVFYYNGFLYWDAEISDIKLNKQFNSYPSIDNPTVVHYRSDLVRGMTNYIWSYDKNFTSQTHPGIYSLPMERVAKHISYNTKYTPPQPKSSEVIRLSFAKSHPEDGRSPLITGVRVIDPYGNKFGDLSNAGGNYEFSIIPATLRGHEYATPIYGPWGQMIGSLPPIIADDKVTLEELNNAGYSIWAPYERETKGFTTNNGWALAGLDDNIPPIPYNKETLILTTDNPDIMIDFSTNNEISFPKESRFEGSAFLRLIQKIEGEEEVMLAHDPPHHHAIAFKNDHNFICHLPHPSAESAQLESTPEHYVGIETKYNYYNEDYENTAANESIKEPLLPSLLIIAAEELTDPGQIWDGKTSGPIETEGTGLQKLKENIHDFVTLNKRMKTIEGEDSALIDNSKTKEYDPFEKGTDILNTGKEKDIGEYFQKWAETIEKDISDNSSLEHLTNNLSSDLRELSAQFQSQIILPDLLLESASSFDSFSSFTFPTATGFYNKKDPLSYEGRKLMFPAYTHIKIGTHAEKTHKSGEAQTLLNYVIKNHLALPVLRAIQERADDHAFDMSQLGNDKEFWVKSVRALEEHGDWDSFTLDKTTGDGKSHDFSLKGYTAINNHSRGNDMFFYRNPYPQMRPEKELSAQALTAIGTTRAYLTHRSWLHYYFEQGSKAYDALPQSDEYPGEAKNIVAAAHGDDTDVAVGMSLLDTEDFAHAASTTRRMLINKMITSLNSLIRKKTRTLEQICTVGLSACDETLFWRIRKTKVKSNGNEESVQNFYLLNDPTKNEINFVDTQIKYGEKYKYYIYAWKAVFGTETEYQFPKSYYTSERTLEDMGPLTQTKMEGWQYAQQALDENTAAFIAGEDSDLGGSESIATPEELDAAGITQILNEPTLTGYDEEKWQLILDALSYPSIRLVETLFHETGTQIVLDRPPLPPMMEIHPYRGINDTYLIRLNAIIGESVKAFPQAIFTEDANKFYLNMMSEHPNSIELGSTYGPALLAVAAGIENPFTQAIIPGGQSDAQSTLQDYATNPKYQEWYGAPLAGAITFRSDDPPKEFEVFMLGPDPETGSPRPPKSYIDFANAERIVLPIEQGTSTSFRPDITPNKKYYYTFRSVDIHGNISFPSKIYEVELVDDSGAIYLVTNIYEFPEPKKVMKKDVRKFMNIIPSSTQTTYEPPEDGSYINFTPAMGPLFESNKRYKFRLTSKKSGKKLDINVKVKMTKRKTEEEKTS